MNTILIVDDKENYREILSVLLLNAGYDVLTAGGVEEAWEIILSHEISLVLTDMTMPGLSGLDLLKKIKDFKPEIPVIMLTAYATVELAVEAMKIGAFDYLVKTNKNDEILRNVAKGIEVFKLNQQIKELNQALKERYSFGKMIGKSKPMLELYRMLEKVSPTKANILITGESGTGKELVARAIHYNSPRAKEAFIAVNCSALSSSLLESELFGHEKGAFTDAKTAKLGRFEMANKGTLFLDEIGEMDLSMQVKLLRVLQERTFERVGSGQSIQVDVRIVAATNRDLKQEVLEGRFREDLFYRLNVVHVILPPLRQRLDDLPLLIGHFLEKYKNEGTSLAINKEALKVLFDYHWPGNVRELENVIERGAVLSNGDEIQLHDLPEEIIHNRFNQIELEKKTVLNATSPQVENNPQIATKNNNEWIKKVKDILPENLSLDNYLNLLEEAMIREALANNNNVQSKAADALGIKKNVFKYKWDKYFDKESSQLIISVAKLVPKGISLVDALEDFEEYLINQALEIAQNVQSKAAELLGIKKNLMHYKLKKIALKASVNAI